MFLKKLFKIIIVLGGIYLILHSFSNITYKVNNQIKLSDYYVNKEIASPKAKDNFIATLEIPQINFKQGLYNKTSKYNSVDYGLEIIDNTDFPEFSDLLIIAGHSGNSKLAYFNDLDKLTLGSIITLNYQTKIYNYKLVKYYEIEKTGKLSLPEFENKTLCLVTCKKHDKTKQLVFIATLIN